MKSATILAAAAACFAAAAIARADGPAPSGAETMTLPYCVTALDAAESQRNAMSSLLFHQVVDLQGQLATSRAENLALRAKIAELAAPKPTAAPAKPSPAMPAKP